jgi:hypothetical protein
VAGAGAQQPAGGAGGVEPADQASAQRALQREIDSHRAPTAQLQQAKLDADAANHAKSRYITTISHELRTPLNSILGYAQLLEEDDAMPPHRRQAVSVIRRGGDHLLSLIEGTLDIARIESGQLALDVRPMRFADGVAEIARMFELQAAGRGPRVPLRRRRPLAGVVRADEKRLRQILINLLGNAIKFTARGDVSLRVAHQREMARFEIADTGPGMSADELARVFEPSSAARGERRSVGSTGLGLTIARMLTTDGRRDDGRAARRAGHDVRDPPVPCPRRTAAAGGAARAAHRLRRRAPPRARRRQRGGRPPPLLDLLQPLGFEVAQRGSRRAALALLARPAAVDASSWTWRCLASTAGRRSAACAPRRRGAAGGGVGQRLRQRLHNDVGIGEAISSSSRCA